MLWKKLKSKIILQTPWIKIAQDDVIMPNGKQGLYTYVKRTNGIGLIVRDGDEVFMVKQYRYPVAIEMNQFPFEGLEENETEEEGAIRCAAEELGIKVTNLKNIGAAYTDAGLNTQRITYFSADFAGETKATTFDETEELEIVKVPINTLYLMPEKGEIEDFHTITGIFYFLGSLSK